MPTSPIPGATVLATYPTSNANDYRYGKAVGLSQAIRGAMDNYRARRDQQEAREQDEIKQFYAMALSNPDIAATQGDWFVSKYGRKYPQLAPLVDFIKNKHAEGEAIQSSGQRFLETQGRIEDKYRRDMETLSAMPDTVPVQVPVPSFVTRDASDMGTIEMDVPNPDKAARQAQLSHIEPWKFQHYAAAAMTPLERQQAITAGAYTLHQFDPREDVPVEQRPLYWKEWLNEDEYTAARAKSGLQQSPATVEGQKFKTSERQAHEAAAGARQERSAELQIQRETLSDKLQRARMALSASIQSGRIAERAALHESNGNNARGDKGKPLWEVAVNESADRVKTWQDGKDKAISEARATAPNTKEAASAAREAVGQYVAGGGEGTNGRPARLTATQARRISDAAQEDVRAGRRTPEEARFGVVAAVELFSRLTQQGTPADKALEMVLRGDDGTGNAATSQAGAH